MKSKWNEPQLRELADALPRWSPKSKWELWATRARTWFRTKQPDHLAALEGLLTLPHPPGSTPIGIGIVGEGHSRPRALTPAEEEQHWGNAIQQSHDAVLALLETVDALMEPTAAPDAVSRLLHLLDRFPEVARQLRHRHDRRRTLKIKDEYDVQDLLHALLLIEFEDIREEEHTPSQGGTSGRVDFLLFNENIVVEVKKTRKGLGNTGLKKQINDDIGHYQRHHDCKMLVCFVYDPDHLVKNPRGFETDFTRSVDPLPVVTLVRPQ